MLLLYILLLGMLAAFSHERVQPTLHVAAAIARLPVGQRSPVRAGVVTPDSCPTRVDPPARHATLPI